MTDSTHVIRQDVLLNADPSRVFAALTDAAQFNAFSGAPAEIEANAGGAFSCFGGMITGRSIELVPGERVVQAWRAKPWPAGTYSLVQFELSDEGGKTRVLLTHSAFPEGQGVHLAKGWDANYWEPLRKHFV